MPRGSIVLAFNSKRFGRVGEIQAHWSKVKILLLQRCVRNQITSDRRYKQVWSDRVLCISFILSIVDNRIPRVFSISNMAAVGEDLGKWLYSGRHYPCLLNKGNADSEERDLMQAFLSPEPVVSLLSGFETSGSGDENGMHVTHVPRMRNSNLGLGERAPLVAPPNCKNQDALVMAF